MMTSDNCWVLYVLQCSDGTFYTGITNNISKRIKIHNLGKGAKYTRSRSPCTLAAKSSFFSKSHCAKAESKFKRLCRRKKEYFVLEGLDLFFAANFSDLCQKEE